MAPGFHIDSTPNTTESVNNEWTKNSPALAGLVMSIVVVIFAIILTIYCYQKKKLCFRSNQKIATEIENGQKGPNQGQNDFDLPPAYSTLSKK